MPKGKSFFREDLSIGQMNMNTTPEPGTLVLFGSSPFRTGGLSGPPVSAAGGAVMRKLLLLTFVVLVICTLGFAQVSPAELAFPFGTYSPGATAGYCYVFADATSGLMQYQTSTGASCGPSGIGGATTRTWRFPFQGVCQGGVGSAPIIMDTTNAPTLVACPAGTLAGEWQTASGVTTNVWYLRWVVPPGVTASSYAITFITRTADTTPTDADIITPSYACLADGGLPTLASLSFTTLPTITLHPQGTANAQITSTTTGITMTCAAGNVIYLQLNPSTVAYTINFSYMGVDVMGVL